METFRSLFGKLLVFVYHCFDRIVIQGHLPLLSREGHIVFFFRDVRGEYPITPKVLQQRTNAYRAWVDAYAGNHKIPVEKAKKGVSKEEHVQPYLERMERQNRYGLYFIFRSMEQGSCFKSLPPKYATDDPNYRIIRRDRKLYTHLYFYIRDEVLGPLAMCVGTYLPFLIFYYVNGHHYIENELKRGKVAYRMNDNAFLWVADPEALQAAADRLSEEVLRKRLDYWTFALGSQVFREGAGACTVVSGLLDQPSGVLPELYLPAECADPQDLRAELRDGAAESDCRQGDADLRLSQTQAAAGKVLYDVGENRPRTSRAASLRQGCGGEDV